MKETKRGLGKKAQLKNAKGKVKWSTTTVSERQYGIGKRASKAVSDRAQKSTENKYRYQPSGISPIAKMKNEKNAAILTTKERGTYNSGSTNNSGSTKAKKAASMLSTTKKTNSIKKKAKKIIKKK